MPQRSNSFSVTSPALRQLYFTGVDITVPKDLGGPAALLVREGAEMKPQDFNSKEPMLFAQGPSWGRLEHI